jgi:hypothetical protein
VPQRPCSEVLRLKASVMHILTIVGGLVIFLVLSSMVYYGRWLQYRSDDGLIHPERPHPTRLQWALLAVSGTAAAVFWYVLLQEGPEGNQVWPLYAATGATLFCGLVWLSLMMRIWPL